MRHSSIIGQETNARRQKLRVYSCALDWLEPLAAYERLYAPYTFLLESVAGAPRIAGYSFIGLEPRTVFKAKDGIFQVETAAGRHSYRASPLAELWARLQNFQVDGDGFTGGAFGYLSYDIGRWIEKLPRRALDDLRLPDCFFMVMNVYLLFDHGRRRLTAYVLSEPSRKGRAELLLEKLRQRLAAPVRRPPATPPQKIAFTSNFHKEDFISIVERAKKYIFAGDIYQVNLSQRLSAPLSVSPLAVYRLLRRVNPSPFAGLFHFGDWQMVGCSPERLVKLAGGAIETRPIAGTIRRGGNRIQDKALTKKLIKDIKERAEHIMLVDLERNDLGRVAEYASVNVDELMVTEEYSHVIHIVSNVVARLRPGKNGLDLIRACFPGGTITGCPKIRSMEIIEELEPVRRGPYTGSMGHFDFNGDLDLNIIIRTLIIKNGRAYVQAGAGIVADSRPEKEYHETLYKAQALIKAVSVAEAGGGD